MGIPGEQKEKGTESLFKEIIAENFPSLKKELYIQVHETKEHLIISMQKYFFPRKTLLQLPKVNNEEF